MKQLLIAAASLTISMGVSAAGLDDVKTVYLLPMSNGLDQYLAQQLTAGAVLQVVTDPQKADAVLTDHLGATFEQSLADLYRPSPKPMTKPPIPTKTKVPHLRGLACRENAAAALFSW